MPFVTANIDRAIVMTQYDLRGFAHPMGFRAESPNPKNLWMITINLVDMAADCNENAPASWVAHNDSSYDAYLAMCQDLRGSCDNSETEAIQLIVQEIVRQSEEMKAEDSRHKESPYLEALQKDTIWGKVVLALAEAFEVKLAATATI